MFVPFSPLFSISSKHCVPSPTSTHSLAVPNRKIKSKQLYLSSVVFANSRTPIKTVSPFTTPYCNSFFPFSNELEFTKIFALSCYISLRIWPLNSGVFLPKPISSIARSFFK